MRFGNSPSWRIGVVRWSQRFDVASWVRAAYAIDTRAGPVVPGPLASLFAAARTPDPSHAEELSAGWFAWWVGLLEDIVARHGTEPQCPPVPGAFEPPEFLGLAGFPAIQVAARSRCREAVLWSAERKRRALSLGRHRHDPIGEASRRITRLQTVLISTSLLFLSIRREYSPSAQRAGLFQRCFTKVNSGPRFSGKSSATAANFCDQGGGTNCLGEVELTVDPTLS